MKLLCYLSSFLIDSLPINPEMCVDVGFAILGAPTCSTGRCKGNGHPDFAEETAVAL